MVGFDIINLFDQETAINKIMTQLQTETVEFERGRFLRRQRQLRREGGGCWRPEPAVPQVNDFQPPRIIRFNARFSF